MENAGCGECGDYFHSCLKQRHGRMAEPQKAFIVVRRQLPCYNKVKTFIMRIKMWMNRYNRYSTSYGHCQTNIFCERPECNDG